MCYSKVGELRTSIHQVLRAIALLLAWLEIVLWGVVRAADRLAWYRIDRHHQLARHFWGLLMSSTTKIPSSLSRRIGHLVLTIVDIHAAAISRPTFEVLGSRPMRWS